MDSAEARKITDTTLALQKKNSISYNSQKVLADIQTRAKQGINWIDIPEESIFQDVVEYLTFLGYKIDYSPKKDWNNRFRLFPRRLIRISW